MCAGTAIASAHRMKLVNHHQSVTSVAVALFLVAVTACGSQDVLGGDVTGKWRALPNATAEQPTPPAERDQLEFGADGGYSATIQGIPVAGTYATTDGELALTVNGNTTRTSYAAGSDRFVLAAYAPVGAVDGMVGLWSNTLEAGDQLLVTDLDVRADGTASYIEHHTEGQAAERSGSWRAIGDDLELELGVEPSVLHIRKTLALGVLGDPYERM